MIVTIGHETVMAKTTFFGSEAPEGEAGGFDFSRDYPHQNQLLDSLGGRMSKVISRNYTYVHVVAKGSS